MEMEGAPKSSLHFHLFVWQKNKPPARQVEGVALASSKNLL